MTWSGPDDAGVATALLLPARIGSVRLLRELGRGGMGMVWLAHDELLGRHVAVKFLAGAVAAPDDPGFARFLEGARAAAAAQHPCLNAIHSAGLVETGSQSIPYIVLQYVDGPTLSQSLTQWGRLNLLEGMVLLSSICAAVGHLHDRSIVHRDIKPSNLLLDSQGRIIVTDFGLAHRRSAPGATGVYGTPAYMAPEMFNGEVSLRSDVYALGMTAFALWTGAPPFKGSVDELRESHQSAPLPIDRLKQAGVSDALCEVLERATHKQAVFRHKTAHQFWRALATAADYKDDPSRSASIASQLFARATGQAPSVAALPADASPRSFYDTIGAAAQAKRAARTPVEPTEDEPEIVVGRPVIIGLPILPSPAPVLAPEPLSATHALHCLNCGYNRFGLAGDAPCPECGQPDITNQQRQLCLATRSRLFRHFFLLRQPPAGWWEVFDSPSTDLRGIRVWSILLLAVLLAAMSTAAFQTLFHGLIIQWEGRAVIYRADDPAKTPIAQSRGNVAYSYFDKSGSTRRDVMFGPVDPGLRRDITWTREVHFSMPRPTEYLLFLPAIGLMLIIPWVIYRYGWLNLVLRRRNDLSPDTRASMRRAADTHAALHLAQSLWLLLLLILVFPIVAFTSDQAANLWSWWIWLALIVLFPFAVWWKSLKGDRGQRLFDHRARTLLLLIAAGQAALFLLFGLITI